MPFSWLDSFHRSLASVPVAVAYLFLVRSCGFMLDELLGFVFRDVLRFILRIMLFPVALLVCTPFILIRAAILASRDKMKFAHAIADGYETVDVYWWN